MKNQPPNSKAIVSVVTPFLNAGLFLQETINSVLDQTYPHWELLLIDDGSTDTSTAMARQVAARYPDKIRYLEHPGHQNLGKSTSRNLGIQSARGKYLTFLDADDVFLPDKLARQVALLAAQPEAVMVYGRTEYWYSWTGAAKDQKRDYLSKLGAPPGALFQPPELVARYLKDGGLVPCICSLLALRQTVQDIAGFDESIQHLYEDQIFLFKVCMAGPVLVEDGCGERYRQHPGSSSNLAIESGEYHPFLPNASRLSFLKWLRNYAHAQNIADQTLNKRVETELWLYQYPTLNTVVSYMRYYRGWVNDHGKLLLQRSWPALSRHNLQEDTTWRISR